MELISVLEVCEDLANEHGGAYFFTAAHLAERLAEMVWAGADEPSAEDIAIALTDWDHPSRGSLYIRRSHGPKAIAAEVHRLMHQDL